MKKIVLCLALAAPVGFLSSCALLDGVLSSGTEQVQVKNEDGMLLYRDANGALTTESVDPITGIANTPETVELLKTEPGGLLTGAQSLLNMLGPWGTLLATIAAAGAGAYARFRNKQRLEELGHRVSAEEQLELTQAVAKLAIKIIERIKDGTAKVFTPDGKLDHNLLRDWIRQQGKDFSDPAFLDALVQEVSKSL